LVAFLFAFIPLASVVASLLARVVLCSLASSL